MTGGRARIAGPVSAMYDAFMSPAASSPAPHRFTREEYHRMGEAGLFANERVELLDGAIITMSPQKSAHASAVSRAAYSLIRLLGSSFLVRAQLPIVLDDWSEPEPDVAICAPEPTHYQSAHPTAADALLVLEIAESSLAYDRGQKAAAYARSGIPMYCVVDLTARQVEVMTERDRAAGRHRRSEIRTEGQDLPLPGGAALALAEILPAR